MKTILTFYTDGTYHCDGLDITRRVRIGDQPTDEPGCETCSRFDTCKLSHTSELKSSIKDINALKEACKLLGLKEPKHGEHTMFDGKKYTGYSVHLKNWQYPVVVDTKTGEMHYDNYNGAWGDIKELNKLRQHYGVAKAKLIAKKQGFFIKQFTLPNGTIRLEATGM